MIGQVLIDRYRIIEGKASNPYWETFLASDTHRPGYPHCIVKQLRPLSNTPKTPEMVRLLLEERVETRKKLGKRAHVPEILDYFEQDQKLYLVEELISGHSLNREIVQGQVVPEAQVAHWLQTMLKILMLIHQQGVIHQDIQPDNLLRRRPDGKLVLINFRLLKEISIPGVNSHKSSASSADFEGLAYKPPEQLAGNPIPASDLYAVGIIAIQMLTGLSAEAIATLRRENGSANSGEILWHRHAQVSRDLAEIIDRLVRQDFKQRYQSAEDGLRGLNQKLFGIETTLPMPEPLLPKNVAPKASARPAIHPERVTLRSAAAPIAAATSMVVAQSSSLQTVTPDQKATAQMLQGSPNQKTRRPVGKIPWLSVGTMTLLVLGGLVLGWHQQIPSAISAQASLRQGLQLSQKEDFKGAIAKFNQAIETQGSNSEAFYNRGFAHYRLGNYQQALADLTQAIQLKPTHAKALFYRGSVRSRLGDDQGALQDYDRAIQLDPKFAPVYMNRGTAKAQMGDEKAALADYNQAVQLDAKLAKAYLNRCLTRSNLDDQPGAMQDCTQAINLDPNYALAYQNRGLVYRRQGNVQSAIADFNVAIRLIPQDADPYYNRGLARIELGDRPGAIADFDTAIRLNPTHTLVYYDRGLVRAEMGDRSGAIQDFQQSAKLCLDQGKTNCYKDAQYQLKQLQQPASSQRSSPTN